MSDFDTPGEFGEDDTSLQAELASYLMDMTILEAKLEQAIRTYDGNGSDVEAFLTALVRQPQLTAIRKCVETALVAYAQLN